MSTADRPRFMEYAEWDWVYTDKPGGIRLHHLREIDNPDTVDRDWWAEGVSTCGVRSTWRIPGLFDRMGTPRCAHCCDRLGIPRGTGSPKNDEELREWVEKRVEAMS